MGTKYKFASNRILLPLIVFGIVGFYAIKNNIQMNTNTQGIIKDTRFWTLWSNHWN